MAPERLRSDLPVALLALTLFAVPLARNEGDLLGMVKWLLLAAGIGLASVAWAATGTFDEAPTFRWSPLHLPFLVWVALLALSIVTSPYPAEPLERWREMGLCLLAPLLLPQSARCPRKQWLLVLSYLLSMALVCGIGIGQYHGGFGTDWGAVPWEKGLGKRVFSTLWNPNFLAAGIVSGLAWLVTWFLSEAHRPRRLLAAGLIGVFFQCLLYTNSWGGALGLVVALPVAVAMARPWRLAGDRRSLGRDALLVCFMLLLMGKGYVDQKGAEIAGESTGLETRFLDWTSAARLIGEMPPWGRGWGNFAVYGGQAQAELAASPEWEAAYERNPSFVGRHPRRVHQLLLSHLLELGWAGLAALGWLLLTAFRLPRQELASNAEATWLPGGNEAVAGRVVHGGALAALAGLMAHAQLSPLLYVSNTMLMFVAILGLVASSGPLREVAVPRPAMGLIGAGIAIATIWGGLALWTTIPAQRLFREANRRVALADPAGARTLLEEMAWVPDEGYHVLLGNARRELGDVAGAAEAYRELLAVRPHHWEGHLALGMTLLATEPETAFRHLKQARRLEPRRPDAYGPLLEQATLTDDAAEVQELLLAIARHFPMDPELANMAILLQAWRGQLGPEQAAGQLLALAETTGDNAYLKHNARLLRQPSPRGLPLPEVFRRFIGWSAVQRIRQEIRRSVALMGQGQLAPAEAGFRRILEEHPEYVPALTNLGVVAARRGDQAQAIRLWREALALDPGHEMTRRNLATLSRQMDRPGSGSP